MSYVKTIVRQTMSLAPLLLKFYIPILLVLILFVLIQTFYGIRASSFTKDPIQVLGGEAYIGILSNLGILFWTATASITYFTSAIFFIYKQESNIAKFNFYSALFTSLLMADDLYLLHDRILPELFNIPEIVVFIFYGIIFIFYLIYFHENIRKSEFSLFLIASCLLGSSVFIDVISVFIKLPGTYLIEDGLKIMGIITWFLFFWRTDLNYIRKIFSNQTNILDD